MTGLIDTSRSEIIYSRSIGRFRDAVTGQFVPRERVLLEVDREKMRTQTRLSGVTRLLADGKIDLPEWQTRFAAELKDSHIRMSALGAGGRQQLSNGHYGHIGRQLRTEYDYLEGFAKDLKAGKLTPTQAYKRAAMYGESIGITFHRAEQITKARDGFEGMRSLDAGARHCTSCLGHVTDGWVGVDSIVPPGTSCECGRRCRCIVVYRRVQGKLRKTNSAA